MNWTKFILFVMGITCMSLYFDQAVHFQPSLATNVLFSIANGIVSLALSLNSKEL
jgi:hypothetical protein